jgi:hypothetical protein
VLYLSKSYKVSYENLALWLILKMRWPSLLSYLEQNPNNMQFFDSDLAAAKVPIPIKSVFENDEVKKVVKGDIIGKDLYDNDTAEFKKIKQQK